uniref:CDP-alcohol phosphatidyltransferase family protein n=1 Tax=Candidatus Avalokitesvara rifleensis TaxID=3367620 RepID=UPI004029DAAA
MAVANLALILVTDPQKSLEDHAGLPLLKRTLLSAQKGGIDEFIIVDADSDERLRTLLSKDARIHPHVRWSDNDNLPDLIKDRAPEPIMLIKAEAVFDPNIIKLMAQPGLDNMAARVAVRNIAGRSRPGQCTLELNGDDVIDCSIRIPHQTDKHPQVGNPENTKNVQTAGLILARPDALKYFAMKAAVSHLDLCDAVEDILSVGKVKAVDVTNELCMEITSQETMQESKNKLYGLLSLSSDGPFSIHVSRKLSRLVSSVLVSLPITPNQITLLSLFIGLVACWFFLQGGYRYSMMGAVMLYASIILDCSDGEVARLKFMYSKYGGLLDSLCDSTVFSGVLFCAALAIHRDSHMPNIIAVGTVAAVVMFICSNLYFYLHYVKEDPKSDPANSIMRSFANEDSFYLSLLGFTLLDKLPWYLWAVAAGTIVYLFILIRDLMSSLSSNVKTR